MSQQMNNCSSSKMSQGILFTFFIILNYQFLYNIQELFNNKLQIRLELKIKFDQIRQILN